MLLRNIQALDNHFADLRQRPRNRPLLAFILACNNQDGITFLDVHLGEVQGLFFFLLYCHIFPQKFIVCLCRTRGTTNINENVSISDEKPVPYSTSGASEMIFIKLRSRSSRATGPKIRVPRGLLPAAMITAAFSSKRMCEPSGRAYSFATRTTTAFTTSPFFTCPLGAACFTDALMMSPISAYLLAEPLKTRIHMISFAPVLSATFRRVCG